MQWSVSIFVSTVVSISVLLSTVASEADQRALMYSSMLSSEEELNKPKREVNGEETKLNIAKDADIDNPLRAEDVYQHVPPTAETDVRSATPYVIQNHRSRALSSVRSRNRKVIVPGNNETLPEHFLRGTGGGEKIMEDPGKYGPVSVQQKFYQADVLVPSPVTAVENLFLESQGPVGQDTFTTETSQASLEPEFQGDNKNQNTLNNQDIDSIQNNTDNRNNQDNRNRQESKNNQENISTVEHKADQVSNKVNINFDSNAEQYFRVEDDEVAVSVAAAPAVVVPAQTTSQITKTNSEVTPTIKVTDDESNKILYFREEDGDAPPPSVSATVTRTKSDRSLVRGRPSYSDNNLNDDKNKLLYDITPSTTTTQVTNIAVTRTDKSLPTKTTKIPKDEKNKFISKNENISVPALQVSTKKEKSLVRNIPNNKKTQNNIKITLMQNPKRSSSVAPPLKTITKSKTKSGIIYSTNRANDRTPAAPIESKTLAEITTQNFDTRSDDVDVKMSSRSHRQSSRDGGTRNDKQNQIIGEYKASSRTSFRQRTGTNGNLQQRQPLKTLNAQNMSNSRSSFSRQKSSINASNPRKSNRWHNPFYSNIYPAYYPHNNIQTTIDPFGQYYKKEFENIRNFPKNSYGRLLNDRNIYFNPPKIQN